MENLLNKLEIDSKTCERINESIEYFKSLDKDTSEKIFQFIENDLSDYLLKMLCFKKSFDDLEFDEDKAIDLNKKHDAIIQKGEQLTDSISNRIIKKQIRAFFRDMGSTLFYESEMFEKGLKKLRGYPGDFEMMDYVYNNQFSAKSIFGQYLDHYFLINAYSQAVRGRKNKMKEILVRILSAEENPRIFNVPCGPSRDVLEALSTFTEKIQGEIVCVDNDQEALDFSRNSIAQIKNSSVVKFLKGNILDYVRHPDEHKEELGEFDYVYSIGIADYFPDKFLQRFINFSFNLVKDGGVLIIAFKIKEKDPSAPLTPKWVCDWEFVPRSYEDSIRVIKSSKLDNYNIIKTEWEESDRICFISIKKK